MPRSFLTRRPGTVWLAVTVVAALLLLVLRQLPGLDMAVTEVFHVEGLCQRLIPGIQPGATACTPFPLVRDEVAVLARKIGIWIPYLVGLAALLALVVRLRMAADAASLRAPLLVLGSLLLGPVLIANVWLKAHLGRPRPEDTVDFFGLHPFVAPGDYSTFCTSNCSFVSGEATFAVWACAGVLLLPRRLRAATLVVATTFAIAVAGLRLAFGKHYLSDVVMGAMVAIWALAAVHWWLSRTQLHVHLAGWRRLPDRARDEVSPAGQTL